MILVTFQMARPAFVPPVTEVFQLRAFSENGPGAGPSGRGGAVTAGGGPGSEAALPGGHSSQEVQGAVAGWQPRPPCQRFIDNIL